MRVAAGNLIHSKKTISNDSRIGAIKSDNEHSKDAKKHQIIHTFLKSYSPYPFGGIP